MRDNSDEKLINAYLKGDEKSLEILIGKYLKPVYRFVYGYVNNFQEAEDITQETFVRMWRNLKKFDQTKSFKTWIFTIAKNASIDFLRRSRVKKSISFSEFSASGGKEGENAFEENFIDPSLSPDKLLENTNLSEIFLKAVEKLFPKYREVILLRHNDQLTFREIAESLNEPLNTVKSRYRRGLIILKNYT